MPYTRPYSGGFVDYPSTTTPINSTALNTMDVGIKTANDQFQTVTTAQRTALTPTVGQCVWDSDLRQLMVFMNASGGNTWQPIGNRLVCASTTRPSSPFEGQQIYETDSNKTLTYNGSTWIEESDLDWLPATGSYANRYAAAKRSSGDLTLNSTVWANVDTGLDLNLNASTGDVIEYVPSLVGPNGYNVALYFDVATIVSGSVVNAFSTEGAQNNALYGVSGWYFTNSVSANVYATVSGSIFYTLQSGDISSGTVTLRFRYRTDTATNRVIYASTNFPLKVWARNHGPVTT